MTVITSVDDFNVGDLFIDLRYHYELPLLLKCEGMNFAGSVKMKAALSMLDAAERTGRLVPGSTLVESSSGNLGIALAMVAAARGYRLVCVTDIRCNVSTAQTIRALGAHLEIIDTPAADGGFLAARIARVHDLVTQNPSWVWLDQYRNPANWQGHYDTTGPEILQAVDHLDVLFLGAGTGGTLVGTTRYVREHSPTTTVVAIDSRGSVTFGGPPEVRHIPGLGAGVRPPLIDADEVDDIVIVDEADTVRACRALAARGFLLGGSTGTVVAGAGRWLHDNGGPDTVAVAVSADFGDRYVGSVYDDEWALAQFGPEGILPAVPGTTTGDRAGLATDVAPHR